MPGFSLHRRQLAASASQLLLSRSVSRSAPRSTALRQQQPRTLSRRRLVARSQQQPGANDGPEAQTPPDRNQGEAKGSVTLLPSIDTIQERVGDLKALAATVWFILGIILIEFGVEGLLDLWIGDDVFGAVCCMIAGVSMVLWVRLSGFKMLTLWSSDNGGSR